jgi:hypothetical protein
VDSSLTRAALIAHNFYSDPLNRSQRIEMIHHALYVQCWPEVVSSGNQRSRRWPRAWARGDWEATEQAVSEALIEPTSISGAPEQCRARVEAHRQSGIDAPIVSPFARGPDAKRTTEKKLTAMSTIIALSGRNAPQAHQDRMAETACITKLRKSSSSPMSCEISAAGSRI